jgi:hypothetical protein
MLYNNDVIICCLLLLLLYSTSSSSPLSVKGEKRGEGSEANRGVTFFLCCFNFMPLLAYKSLLSFAAKKCNFLSLANLK